MRRRTMICAAVVAMVLLTGGCGEEAKEQEPLAAEEAAGEGQDAGEAAGSENGEEIADGKSTDGDSEKEKTGSTAADEDLTGGTDDKDTDSPEEAVLKERFGENCIASQTFAIELNGCEAELWFVPYAPFDEHSAFHAQVMRDGEVFAELSSDYVPENAAGNPFSSLDAVSFWDVNFDGLTDIVMIATYGDAQVGIVYYGDHFQYSDGSESWSFQCREKLSDCVTAYAKSLTIPGIRALLSNGKRNGEFADYAEAYETMIDLAVMERGGEGDDDFLFDLIYVDEDEIPELVSGLRGYYVNLYTYEDGTLYQLMDSWAYGAMGNAGYEYAPGDNSIRNYNADYAGAIMDTTYMRINDRHEIETMVWIETYQFDDVNGNGIPDEGEDYEGTGASFINGKEVSEEEMAAVYPKYDMGNYQMIIGTKTAEEVRRELRESK